MAPKRAAQDDGSGAGCLPQHWWAAATAAATIVERGQQAAASAVAAAITPARRTAADALCQRLLHGDVSLSSTHLPPRRGPPGRDQDLALRPPGVLGGPAEHAGVLGAGAVPSVAVGLGAVLLWQPLPMLDLEPCCRDAGRHAACWLLPATPAAVLGSRKLRRQCIRADPSSDFLALFCRRPRRWTR